MGRDGRLSRRGGVETPVLVGDEDARKAMMGNGRAMKVETPVLVGDEDALRSDRQAYNPVFPVETPVLVGDEDAPRAPRLPPSPRCR